MKRRKKRSRHVQPAHPIPEKSSMNERLARHLLKRLQRKAMALALADAVEAGILCQEDVESHGRVLSVYRANRETGMIIPTRAVAMLSRHRRRLPDETPHPIFGPDEFAIDTDTEAGATLGEQPHVTSPAPSSPEQVRHDDLALVRAVRAAAEPPRASDVAAVLLLAQAVPDDKAALDTVLRALSLRRPIVTVLSETKGFELTFLDLLKRGLILPGAVERSSGYEARYDTLRFERVTAARRRIVTFAGSDRGDEDDEGQYGIAAQSTYPILAVAENQERLSPKLVQAAQLNLACGTLNAEIVRRIIETVLGAPPSAGRLDGIDFGRLGLGDIAIAVRPGVAPDTAANSLRRIAAARFPAVHFLENQSVVIDGVRFLGATLWTDYRIEGSPELAMRYARERMNDYRQIAAQRNPWQRFLPQTAYRMHQKSRRFIETALQSDPIPTVVVTHHLPHANSIPARFKGDLLNAAYASDLSQIIEEQQPALWVHGHTHDSCDYHVGATRIVCNPRGYEDENARFDPGLMLTVDPCAI